MTYFSLEYCMTLAKSLAKENNKDCFVYINDQRHMNLFFVAFRDENIQWEDGMNSLGFYDSFGNWRDM